MRLALDNINQNDKDDLDEDIDKLPVNLWFLIAKC